jgi:hypothetical protein
MDDEKIRKLYELFMEPFADHANTQKWAATLSARVAELTADMTVEEIDAALAWAKEARGDRMRDRDMAHHLPNAVADN